MMNVDEDKKKLSESEKKEAAEKNREDKMQDEHDSEKKNNFSSLNIGGALTHIFLFHFLAMQYFSGDEALN